MKAIGKVSVSWVVSTLLTVSSYAVALVLAVATVLVVTSVFTDVPGLTMMVSPFPPGLNVDHDSRGAALSRFTMSIPVSFNVDSPVTAPSLGIEKAQIQDAHATLRFPTQDRALFFGNAILLIVLLALTLWILGLFRALFRTLRNGQPFVPANAARIRRIAFAVIGGEVARSAIVFFESYYAKTHFAAEGLRLDAPLEFSSFAIVNGLMILAIAEVFRAGTSLDEEQSLTV